MGHVMTVTGPIHGGALGRTLPHEHLIVDLTLQVPFGGLLNEPELAIAELQAFVDQGGQTVVDCGSGPIGRDPSLLREISLRTGLNVVMGSGWYREPFLDRVWVDQHSVDELAAQLVEEIEHGVGDTGIRPGVIGEIGSEHFVTSAEERIMRAAGSAARETGLTVTTHAARWPNGLRQLALLTDQGVDPRKVVIGHCDTIADSGYHQAIAATGAYVQFDTVRGDSAFETRRRVGFVLAMQEAGMLEHVLLSHDVCMRDHLLARGGSGYGFVHGGFADHLRDSGLSEDSLQLLLVENPRRALTAE
jgi:predicted metal-dependent phosphotriesterase family hydrolase